MARWSSIRGPAAPSAFTGALTAIPGVAVSRYFDGSPLLLLTQCELNAGAGGAAAVITVPTVDGVPHALGTESNLGANATVRVNSCCIVNINPGDHTIALAHNGPAGAGNQVPATGGIIYVVELPAWDQEVNLGV